MNKFKRFYSLLCFLLMFCVGFLSIGNLQVYAYENEDNFYPLLFKESYLRIYDDVWSTSIGNIYPTFKNNKYYYNNTYLEKVWGLAFYTSKNEDEASQFTFPYNPDLYDYYFIGNLTSLNNDITKSTFKPTSIIMWGKDYLTNTDEYYPMSGVGFYDLDSTNYSGFGWYGKVDFSSRDNIGISQIQFLYDKDTYGTKPANLVLDMGILAVDKSSSESAILSQILNQLRVMEESISENIQNASNNVAGAVGQAGEKVSGAVNEAGDKIANKVEEQYQMDESEDFGVGDITEEVEEKLGVLTVGTDTLIGFLDLFDASNAGSTTITFPAFEIEVQGQSYNVWNDISYDLSTLEDDFGILIDSVRTVLVLCVWLAVLSYLVKAKDHFINGGG